ncbi:MAG: polysaccharide deacetylase family protein [Chitinispirillaceae bacterium]|nr:polysaccharide deacetylase family protein [Chitinispirillaceae bacterium]
MSKSDLRPDVIWSFSLAVSFIAWIFLPPFRPFLSVVLLAHLPVLIFGITNLQAGFFCRSYCRIPGELHRCALTFDDGPDPRLTPAVLDLLDEFNVTATFFLIARKARQHAELAREIVNRGHEVACHDLDHHFTANFRRHHRMVREINTACTIIADATGKSPLLYRPPVGLSNPHLRTALAELGMRCIGWDRGLGDGGNRFVSTFTRMPHLAKPGSIVLLHDCLPDEKNPDLFLNSLRSLLGEMKNNGLSGVTVSTLCSLRAYRD